jgi:hypothetical protein
VTVLPPWTSGPFELIVHAESHLRDGDDFDRRIALISFDNAIEVTITTYLTLKPIPRGNKSYSKTDVEQWLANFHTKLDFLDAELTARGESWAVDKASIVYVHDHRNEQYHGGLKGTPEKSVLEIVRQAALWVFSLLFAIPGPEALLEQALIERMPPAPPSREKRLDLAIDAAYGVVEVGDQSCHTSELLFEVDHDAYVELGNRLYEELTEGADDAGPESEVE